MGGQGDITTPSRCQKPLLLNSSPMLPQVTLSHASRFLCSTLLTSYSKKRRTFSSIRLDFCSINASSFPGGPLTEAIKLCIEVQLGMGKQDIRAAFMQKTMARVCHTGETTSPTG